MKRFRVILLFLLLGAIVNVAVAWGIATWVMAKEGRRDARVDVPGFIQTGWICSRYDTIGVTQLIAMAVKSYPGTVDSDFDEIQPGWSNLSLHMDETVEESRREAANPENANVKKRITPYVLMQHAFGFPLRCLYWNWEMDSGNVNIRFSYSLSLKPRPSLPQTTHPNEQRALPLGIIPFGFAINTISYASLLWFLISGLSVLRRYFRHKRGLCVKCAYDLRGADHLQCPECGRR